MSQRVRRSERRKKQRWRESMAGSWREQGCCVKCGDSTEYTSPDTLCRFHWIEWFVSDDKQSVPLTVQQKRRLRRELLETIRKFIRNEERNQK